MTLMSHDIGVLNRGHHGLEYLGRSRSIWAILLPLNIHNRKGWRWGIAPLAPCFTYVSSYFNVVNRPAFSSSLSVLISLSLCSAEYSNITIFTGFPNARWFIHIYSLPDASDTSRTMSGLAGYCHLLNSQTSRQVHFSSIECGLWIFELCLLADFLSVYWSSVNTIVSHVTCEWET